MVSTAAIHARVHGSFPGLLAQCSLFVHKSGLKPDLFHFI